MLAPPALLPRFAIVRFQVEAHEEREVGPLHAVVLGVHAVHDRRGGAVGRAGEQGGVRNCRQASAGGVG